MMTHMVSMLMTPALASSLAPRSTTMLDLAIASLACAGLDVKACTWLRDFLPIFPKTAVRQTVEGHWAPEGNSKLCEPLSPTLYSSEEATL